MNDGGDCRTAPATPGLLKKYKGVCRTCPATLGLLNIKYAFQNVNLLLRMCI